MVKFLLSNSLICKNEYTNICDLTVTYQGVPVEFSPIYHERLKSCHCEVSSLSDRKTTLGILDRKGVHGHH